MPLNSVGQYTGNHKVWDHLGNVVPNVEYSEGERPAGEFKPATWLPVKLFDKYFEDWAVILPGKALAFDNDGRVIPAGYGVTGATVVYTADDVAAGVTDVTTGVAVAAPVTYNVSDIDGTPGFMGRTGVVAAFSKPVGVAPFTFKQWAGGDGVNPTQLRLHNYNMQHLVTILCDYVLSLPLVPNKITAEAMTFGAPSGNKSTATAAQGPIAKNTVRTPTSFAGGASATLFVNQKDTAASVLAAGDWHIDLTTKVVTVYKLDGSGAPAAITMTYSFYGTAAGTAQTSAFACVKGNVLPGSFLKIDVDSNFVLADPASDNFSVCIAQVLEIVDFPRGGLEKVRTAYQPALNTTASAAKPGYAGQMDQMPGSATGGVPDAVHYSGASNLMVHLNIIGR